MITLSIEQNTIPGGKYSIALTLKQDDQGELKGKAEIEFALSDQEQADLRWYMEDYLQQGDSTSDLAAGQIEAWMKQRGEELYHKVLDYNDDTRAIWFAVRNKLADLRVEIESGVVEAASIPWELMRDPQSDSAIAVRVKSFVRTYKSPNISFVSVPPAEEGCLRLLYVVCRPEGGRDVKLRAIANRLLQDLGAERNRFEITALRPPTYECLQKVLQDAKNAGKPFHIVHFDGHGVYADLSETTLAEWGKAISAMMLGSKATGKHGYLLFENPGNKENIRPVSGAEIGQLLHDNGVPVLVLNACQTAMQEFTGEAQAGDVHEKVRAIGSLAQEAADQGLPAVLGMRYSVYVVTAAQYVGELYKALAQGLTFGEAASQARKHLARNPDRWVGLAPRPLQDWFVPVTYEATPPVQLLPPGQAPALSIKPVSLDPVQNDPKLLRQVPETGFIGRDETLLAVDRAFDQHPVVLLHAYAGQGKSATAVEFARWYAGTGGLGANPLVLWTSFEQPTDLGDALNQIGGLFDPILKANGIEWHALNDLNARRSIVLQIMRQVAMLWIWDNVEPVAGFPEGTPSQWTEQEQRELRDFLQLVKEDRATKTRILLTSRRDEQAWLGGIPERIIMPPMRREDSAALALNLGAEQQASRAEIANWQSLLDYCQGNPLTLRVLVRQAVNLNLHGREKIEKFVEDIRSGEETIQDVDAKEGRDKSLGASLEYGFKNAFQEDELPIIALLHLFQGVVFVQVLQNMGYEGTGYALPELKSRILEELNGLLERARETGLLTSLSGGYYSIHPALPWFLRQLFARHYDGQNGRSSDSAAQHAWVETIGGLGDYYFEKFSEGNRDVVQYLDLEEANLLQARRSARRNNWWDPLTSAMQGLRVLYNYQGRTAEWARLVAEITPDYCTPDDAPLPGREDGYGLVIEYRMALAHRYDLDLPRAATLQEKRVAWDRQRAAPALALPADTTLDPEQRHRILSLAMSTGTLGQILMEQGSPDCVAAYKKSIRHFQRIKDTAAEAISHFNLGQAYKDLSAIRDLEAAEAAYQRSLALCDPNDALGRARCIQQIGTVHHERFRESRRRGEPAETLLQHAQTAESHYLQSLALCPPTALTELGPIHNQLGNLYYEVDQTEHAREHYEKDVQICEQTGNRYGAGKARFNIALMYREVSRREAAPAHQRDMLLRAQAYAQAALRDFQHYQGRVAKDEAEAQRLIDEIESELKGIKG